LFSSAFLRSATTDVLRVLVKHSDMNVVGQHILFVEIKNGAYDLFLLVAEGKLTVSGFQGWFLET
jgi:hypothetical protein